MMFGLFLSCFLFYRFVEEKVQYDADTATSSPYVRKHSLKTNLALKADIPKDEVKTIQAAPAGPEQLIAPAEEASRDIAVVEDAGDSEQVEVAWDELNQKWQSELKDYLFSVDPENAEEVFDAYMKVGKNETPEDIHAEDMTEKHMEKLKQVFGAHFDAVQGLHQEYVNSVQEQAGSDTQLYLQL